MNEILIDLFKDDTYMYDDEARYGNYSSREFVGDRIQHWYDEPPYESDPEDFLMGCIGGDVNPINTGRVIGNNDRYSTNCV